MQIPHVNATQADIDAQTDKRFGYCLENPIKATNIMVSCIYVDMLQPSGGGRFTSDRVLVYEMPNGHCIDVYKLTNSQGGEPLTIYVDGYCSENSKDAPEGCILSKPQSRPQRGQAASSSSTGCMLPLAAMLATATLSIVAIVKVLF